MPGAARLGDTAQISSDAHGCPGCPHPGTGPAIMGSPTVNINGKPAVRKTDMGMHAACCGPNMWTANAGSGTVKINDLAAFRQNDATQHCGGSGTQTDGSSDVIVGD